MTSTPPAEPPVSSTCSVDPVTLTCSSLQTTRKEILHAEQNPGDHPAEVAASPSGHVEAVSLTSSLTPTRHDHVVVQEKPDVAADEIFHIPTNFQSNKDKGLHKDEKLASTDNDEVAYPEGGLGAWLVVVGSCFGCTVTLGMMLVDPRDP